MVAIHFRPTSVALVVGVVYTNTLTPTPTPTPTHRQTHIPEDSYEWQSIRLMEFRVV